MRILLACQRSGLLRELLRHIGHDAITCDIEPCEDGSQHHIQNDVRKVMNESWDVMIAMPECRYLCSSGQHNNDKPGQRTTQDVEDAVSFFMLFVNSKIKHRCIENSIGIMSSRYRKPDQIVQPYNHGDDASKSTCLWMFNFPLLTIHPELYVQPRIVDGKKRWSNQTDSGQNRLGPSKTRSMDRARTYPGIARGLAEAVWKI